MADTSVEEKISNYNIGDETQPQIAQNYKTNYDYRTMNKNIFQTRVKKDFTSLKKYSKGFQTELHQLHKKIDLIHSNLSSTHEMMTQSTKKKIFQDMQQESKYFKNIKTKELSFVLHSIKTKISSDVANLISEYDQKRIKDSLNALPPLPDENKFQTEEEFQEELKLNVLPKYCEHDDLVSSIEQQIRSKIAEKKINSLPSLVHDVLPHEAHEYEKMRIEAFKNDKGIETVVEKQKKFIDGKITLQKLATPKELRELTSTDKLTDDQKSNWEIVSKSYKALRPNVQHNLKKIERQILLGEASDEEISDITELFAFFRQEFEKRFKKKWRLWYRRDIEGDENPIQGGNASEIQVPIEVETRIKEDANRTAPGVVFDTFTMQDEGDLDTDVVYTKNPLRSKQYLVFKREYYNYDHWLKQINAMVKEKTKTPLKLLSEKRKKTQPVDVKEVLERARQVDTTNPNPTPQNLQNQANLFKQIKKLDTKRLTETEIKEKETTEEQIAKNLEKFGQTPFTKHKKILQDLIQEIDKSIQECSIKTNTQISKEDLTQKIADQKVNQIRLQNRVQDHLKKGFSKKDKEEIDKKMSILRNFLRGLENYAKTGRYPSKATKEES